MGHWPGGGCTWDCSPSWLVVARVPGRKHRPPLTWYQGSGRLLRGPGKRRACVEGRGKGWKQRRMEGMATSLSMPHETTGSLKVGTEQCKPGWKAGFGIQARCIPGQPASLLPSSGRISAVVTSAALHLQGHCTRYVLVLFTGPSEVSDALYIRGWRCIPSALRLPGASPACRKVAWRPQTLRDESVPEPQVPELRGPGIPVRRGLTHWPTHKAHANAELCVEQNPECESAFVKH